MIIIPAKAKWSAFELRPTYRFAINLITNAEMCCSLVWKCVCVWMKGKTGDGETLEPSREVFEKFNIKKLIFRRMRERENIIISILCAASACHNTHNLLHLILRSQGKWSAMAALKRHDNCVSWNKHIRWLYYFISFQMECSNVFFSLSLHAGTLE